MTKKRYPKTACVSRSRQRRAQDGGQAQGQKARRSLKDAGSLARLAKDPYRYFTPGIDSEHPVDDKINRLPDIVRARRRIHRTSARLRKCSGPPHHFVEYEDAWTAYVAIRDECYYNAGFDSGVRLAPMFRNTSRLSRPLQPVLRALAFVQGIIPDRLLATNLIEIAHMFLLVDEAKIQLNRKDRLGGGKQ